MDRHKYRAWFNFADTGWKMVELRSFEIVEYTGGVIGIKIQNMNGEYFQGELDTDCILMQCIGLKDSQGNLIYEGDVVEIYDKESEVYHPGNPEIPRVGCVFWDDDEDVVPGWYVQGKLHPRYSPGRNPFYGHEGQDFKWSELKIIGSIYENPELMEK